MLWLIVHQYQQDIMPRDVTLQSPTFDLIALFFVAEVHWRSLRLYKDSPSPKDNDVGVLFNFSGVATKNAVGTLGTSCK